jgi:hypothetical protein
MSSRKSYDKSGVVALELSVLERRVSEAGTDDGDALEGYTSSVGSTRDLNSHHREREKALKFAKS